MESLKTTGTQSVPSGIRTNAKRISASKSVSRILFPGRTGTAIIHLAPTLLLGSSDLPESWPPLRLCSRSRRREAPRCRDLRGGPPLLSYLVLLRVGFAMPPASLPGRCALTLIPMSQAAPFHPYLTDPANRESSRRYIFCGTFRFEGVRPELGIPLRPSPLASTVPYGVRTFLSPAVQLRLPLSEAEPRAGQRSPNLLARGI